jgi:carbon monoxide dehydrogenase subunit G
VTSIEGTRLIDARRERVFAALLDPDVVAGAIPVIRSHREVDVDHWEAKIKAPIPLAPSVTIRFEVLEKRPPEHASVHSRGGGAHVASSFDLEAVGDDATRVRWHVDIELHGILGAFSAHGLEPVARRAAEHVLDRVAATATSP